MATSTKRRRRRRRSSQSNLLVLRLLILVVLVIVVFEGRIIHIMFTQGSGNVTATASTASANTGKTNTGTADSSGDQDASSGESTDATPKPAEAIINGEDDSVTLAGISIEEDAEHQEDTPAPSTPETEDPNKVSEALSSSAVVEKQAEPVDDSYFSNAVFIGDSRMEGFRNTSGITQGTFMTSVGMSIDRFSKVKVKSTEGEITIYQGLSGKQYSKIYLMLGTNDLGYYPWEMFKPDAEGVFEHIHSLQPNAVIYICGVIYVEGQKISTSYVNNDNVRLVNKYLLEACEDLDYCHYLNLNEIFTNGYGSLIDGATADGVHLNPQYSVMMLDYLKSHYIPIDEPEEAVTEADTQAQLPGIQ